MAAALGVLAVTVVLVGPPRQAPPAPPGAAATGVADLGRTVPDDGAAALARTQAVTGLLDRWAVAVRNNDVTALTALLDPAADPAFVRSELARAGNMAGVPLADWAYEITAETAPVVDPELTAQLAAEEVWAPPVVLRYALAGVDDLPTRKSVGLVVARRGDQWRLVSDDAMGDGGRQTWRGPWDFGPVVSRTSAQGVVLGHPGQEAQLDALVAELVSGVPAVTEFWGGQWPQHAAVVLAASQPELSALVGPDFDGGGVAAVTTADAVDLRSGTATGVRVVFNPATLPRLTGQTLPIVLRHELTHVAARTVTADRAPLWMLEGFADYSGYRGRGVRLADGAPAVAALVRSGAPPDALPTEADFRSSIGSEVAYQLSWSFALFLADTLGEDVLRSAYRLVAALPDPVSAELDSALLSATGADLAELVAGWRAWLLTQLP